MTLTSDLDLVFVYDCDDPSTDQTVRARLLPVFTSAGAQRLIAASAPTGEGALYGGSAP